MKHRAAGIFANAVDVSIIVHIIDEVECHDRVNVDYDHGENQGQEKLVTILSHSFLDIVQGFISELGVG